ncbi:alkaline phosphatase family protein [Bacteriovoracales bacterium]|nr:alkaline phosphatase family protein [Bacteriovoracales bacterium]
MRLLPIVIILLFQKTYASTIPLSNQKIVTKLAFGSCIKEHKKQKIWKQIRKDNPDLFIFLGDNIYADTEDMEVMKTKYKKLWNNPHFKIFKKNIPIMATWDDHDYGKNDAGKEYPKKFDSKNLFLDFFDPLNSARRKQAEGIHTSYIVGPPGRRLHIIILDTRWSRTGLLEEKKAFTKLKRTLKGMGPYRPNKDPNSRILGRQQWSWLNNEFQKKADLRILVTSIQVLADYTGWEAWANFPSERNRLLKLIKKHRDTKTIILSGDVHRGEIAEIKLKDGYPLVEVTSSGLTETTLKTPPNKNRLFRPVLKPNYGLLKIDWGKKITTLIKGKRGEIYKQYKTPFLK